MKVFAFWGGAGAGAHFPPAPRRGLLLRKLMGKLENQANSSGHLLLFGSRIYTVGKTPKAARLERWSVWSVVCLAFAPGGMLADCFSGRPAPPPGAAREEPLGLSARPGVFRPRSLTVYMGWGRPKKILVARLHIAKRAKRGMCCLAHGCRGGTLCPRVHLFSKHIPRLQFPG